MIELESVTKLYGTVIGVNDIQLSMSSGAYGLLGPNGSGKTTLINLIIGQIRPTLGRVRLFGTNPWTRDHLLGDVGLCPASEMNLPRISAYDWVSHLLRLGGFTNAAAKSKALAALERVKMEHAMYRPIREYSLGMRQRTKLAQAIAHDPQLLILDEPFNGLDPVGRYEMTKFLQQWVAGGKSLIFASHVLHEVEAVQPSFLLISGGRLLASGTPQEVTRILSETPSQLRIRCSEPQRLAALLLPECEVDSLRLIPEQSLIEVSTRRARVLYERLPELATANGLIVHEIQSTDDSLKSLFSTLMKMHRGEN
jgi:ABC-2 type transport system ATP-binding protein